jgi:hypothetical protein
LFVTGTSTVGSERSDGVVSLFGAATSAVGFLTSISSISKLKIEVML